LRPRPPVAIRIECYFPDRRCRDLDNIAKAILDGLQGPGLLPGDHWTVIPSLTITGELDADNPRAVVTIAEVRE
jgi:Holliday junction resolvase RusA-like endonuclease